MFIKGIKEKVVLIFEKKTLIVRSLASVCKTYLNEALREYLVYFLRVTQTGTQPVMGCAFMCMFAFPGARYL